MISQKRSGTKNRWIFLGLLIFAVAVVLAWPLYPITVKRKVIAATSGTKWTEYRRLTKLIALGMGRDEVSKALGAPAKVDMLSVGERWLYFEDGPTDGWLYVAEFRREPKTGVLKLCYVFNKQQIDFPESPVIEIGERLKEAEHEGSIIFGYPPH